MFVDLSSFCYSGFKDTRMCLPHLFVKHLYCWVHVIVGPPQIDQRSGSVARYTFLITETKLLGCLNVIESFYLRRNRTDMYSLICVCLVYLCHSWGSVSLTHSHLLFWTGHCFLYQQCPANTDHRFSRIRNAREPSTGIKLGQRLRPWPSFEPVLEK